MTGLCPFCEIAADRAPATVLRRWPDAMAIVPLNPVTPGHVLIIPTAHAESVVADPTLGAVALERAASWAGEQARPCNLIVSSGPEATQTVPHIHVHYVPRTAGDGLSLPWTRGPN